MQTTQRGSWRSGWGCCVEGRANNLFPRVKTQLKSRSVDGWCSCCVCARLHQSVRHSRRTDSMSRRLAFQRGLLLRALCEDTQNHTRVQSTVGKSVRRPLHHAVGILMRTIAPKALCAIFSHVSLAWLTKSSIDGWCLRLSCTQATHQFDIQFVQTQNKPRRLNFQHEWTRCKSYKQSKSLELQSSKDDWWCSCFHSEQCYQTVRHPHIFTSTNDDDVTPCAA